MSERERERAKRQKREPGAMSDLLFFFFFSSGWFFLSFFRLLRTEVSFRALDPCVCGRREIRRKNRVAKMVSLD